MSTKDIGSHQEDLVTTNITCYLATVVLFNMKLPALHSHVSKWKPPWFRWSSVSSSAHESFQKVISCWLSSSSVKSTQCISSEHWNNEHRMVHFRVPRYEENTWRCRCIPLIRGAELTPSFIQGFIVPGFQRNLTSSVRTWSPSVHNSGGTMWVAKMTHTKILNPQTRFMIKIDL